ncbi:hypothetical protein ACJIZ3_006665 [Penstemon smallii]|uniref:Uncharacterized protein n=1 Tax=Penstemon smallii TaxID=265156 RepID=A0ABD3S8C3_9LAMI
MQLQNGPAIFEIRLQKNPFDTTHPKLEVLWSTSLFQLGYF